MPLIRIALLTVLAVVSAGTCGCGGGPRTPREAVEKMIEAARDKDYGKIWDLLTPSSQARAESSLQFVYESVKDNDEESMALFGHPADKVLRMNGRQRFVALLRVGNSGHRLAADAAAIGQASIGQATVNGDEATVPVFVNGVTRDVHVVKNGVEWRIDGTMACGATGTGSYLLPLLVLLPLLLVARRRERSQRLTLTPTGTN